MKCPRCGRQITKRRRRCEVCGQDISVYERLYRLSNTYYNKGLERAKIRDLSGAISMLKKSLEINKENTEARNLLGLVYYEMGEVVAALSEWVISKHFNPENGEADRYMELVQSDSVEFDNRNQTIKKYNIALASTKQGNDDLAILQLKRVISMNPRYVQALLLLALLYIKNCEYEKARRCLARVQKIDVTNLSALRYMEEIRIHTELATGGGAQKSETLLPLNHTIVPVNSYKEDKPNFMAFITFFLGILIGVAVIYYMAVPNIRKGIVEEYNQKERDYSAIISASEADAASLRSTINILEAKIENLERTLRREEGYVLTDYEPLLSMLYEYSEFLLLEEPTAEQTEEMAEKINQLDMSQITMEDAVALYTQMQKEIGVKAAAAYITEGMSLYAAGEYEAALPVFEKAYQYRKDEPEILYHLARIYHRQGELAKAKALYTEIMTRHETSARYQEAKTYLEYIQEAEQAEQNNTEPQQ